MSFRRVLIAALGVAALGFTAPQAGAIPVTDAGAIAQLISQIDYWKQQIQGMTDQLTQLQTSYSAMTGPRGMQNLLAMSPQMRNYLPSQWRELEDALDALRSAHSALGRKVQGTVTANAVLTPQQLDDLPVEVRTQIESTRRAIALRQITTRTALETSSSRFQSIQQLINAIVTADDQKAALELQARIQAELGMLQNEQIKLQMLQQVSQAEDARLQQREWENAIAGQGRFATRLQMRPR